MEFREIEVNFQEFKKIRVNFIELKKNCSFINIIYSIIKKLENKS